MLDLTLMLYVENNITQVYILLNNDKKRKVDNSVHKREI